VDPSNGNRYCAIRYISIPEKRDKIKVRKDRNVFQHYVILENVSIITVSIITYWKTFLSYNLSQHIITKGVMVKLSKNLKAVIFDMDGVLANTMPFHYKAWRETFRKFGIRVTKKDIYLREGERWNKTFEEILKARGIKPTKRVRKAAFLHREKVFKNLFKVKMFPGAETLLKKIHKKGMKLALVTGTPARELKKILPKRIYKMFDAVVPSDEVTHGKPHPEPYLKALKRLKLKPYQAVVVENAPNGIKSARAAGMKCVAIETSLPKRYLKGADVIVGSIKEVSCCF